MSKASRGSDGKRVSAALRMGAAELLGRVTLRKFMRVRNYLNSVYGG